MPDGAREHKHTHSSLGSPRWQTSVHMLAVVNGSWRCRSRLMTAVRFSIWLGSIDVTQSMDFACTRKQCGRYNAKCHVLYLHFTPLYGYTIKFASLTSNTLHKRREKCHCNIRTMNSFRDHYVLFFDIGNLHESEVNVVNYRHCQMTRKQPDFHVSLCIYDIFLISHITLYSLLNTASQFQTIFK